MRGNTDAAAVDEIRDLARPLQRPEDLDPVLDRIGDARHVLIGEASHGTSEYYRWRAELTKRLVTEQGFSFVAVEGDWPDCARIDRWVRGGSDGSAREVLAGFERWPTWMWANEEVADFLGWLRGVNDRREPDDRVGFHGLDVYSLWDSLREIIAYLDRHDPEAARVAREAWRCFEPYGEEPQEYAWATRLVPTSCEQEVVALLGDLRARAAERDGSTTGDDARFDAEQNAAVAAGAERYYRAMVRGGASSWNVRDIHMADTLDRLLQHYGQGAKSVVWEHNTHVGDARATDMAGAGMVNVGQLVRERHGEEDVVLVGFGSHAGSVVAGEAWGAPSEVMAVPEARDGSHETLLHDAGIGDALFVFPDRPSGWLDEARAHRAIGVVYAPGRERRGNYVPTVLGRRYDVFLYLDRTQALQPITSEAIQLDVEQETYPFGH